MNAHLSSRLREQRGFCLVVALWAAVVFPLTGARAAGDEPSVAPLLENPGLALGDGSLETAIGAAIRASDTAQRDAIESELVAIALDATRTVEERAMACRLVALCAGRSALQLAPMLRDSKLAHSVRFVLEPLPGSEVDQELLAAMAAVEGDLKLGLINSLARRRSAEAVPELATLASSPDTRYAAAALRALGTIGSSLGLEALAELEVSSVLHNVRAEALLKVAQELIDANPRNMAAVRAVEPLMEAEQPPSIRTAAFRLLVAARPRGAVDQIATWINSDDPVMQTAAAGALDLLRNRSAEAALARRASTMKPAAQALLIGGLAARGSDVVLPLARQAVDDADENLRVVAVQTMGRLGSAADVPALLAIAAESGAISEAAIEALTHLPDEKVDARLRAEFNRADSPVRSQLPDVFVARHVTAVLPDLWAVIDDAGADARLRNESLRAIGDLADADFVSALFARLHDDEQNRAEIERALVAMGRKLPEGVVVESLVGSWSEESDEIQTSIVRMTGAIGDPAALAFLLPLAEADPPNEAASRAILGWTSEDALPVLHRWADDARYDDAQRQNIWRALFRLATRYVRDDRDAGIPWLEKSFALASTVEDRRSVIEVLGDNPGDAALELLAQWDDQPELAEALAAARENIHERTDRTPGR